MEAGSVKDLVEIADRVEQIADRIRSLNRDEAGAVIPDVPLPLSLRTIPQWLDDAEECCRKPVLARSKQLLESKGIPSVEIPLNVLSSTDEIAAIVKAIDELNSGFHDAVYEAVGRALTKTLEDAKRVVQTFAAASREIERLAGSRDWVVAIALDQLKNEPSKAGEVVSHAKRVQEYADAAEAKGLQVPQFTSLTEALLRLTDVVTQIQAYETLLAAEGVPYYATFAGKRVEDAIDAVKTATERLKDEKESLQEQASKLSEELVSIGGNGQSTNQSTLSELRAFVTQLRESLQIKRRALRKSLGKSTFRVVEYMAAGKLPPNDVSDQELGGAIRKAVSSGYRLQLEVPHENS